MNNALLYIAGILIAVLAALFAVPHFVDWNGYRGVFEEEASRMLGREVRVGGKVNLRLLPTPYVRFEKVRVAADDAGTGEPMFRADAFTVWLSVPPLLKGVLEANRVELERPFLRLHGDAEGRGSWTRLGLAQGSLPFVPAGVTLQSVKIDGGTLAMSTAAGGDVLRLDAIDGEVEAEALQGPFRFKGRVAWRDVPRDVRLSLSAPDSAGLLRLRAAVAVPSAGNSYALDARIADLGGVARLDGELTGKIALAANGGPAPGGGDDPAAKPPQGERPYIDLKSMISADLVAARLAGITASLENMGQPQIVEGDARIAWGDNPRVELAARSRLVDFDRLTATGPAAAPIESAQRLLGALMAELPAKGPAEARITIDQLTLGGEQAGGFVLRILRDGGPLEIKELKAVLPGGARLDLAGTLGEGGGRPEIAGPLMLRGSSLNRFLLWAGKSRALVDGRTDGSFLVRGRLALSDGRLALSEAVAELAGVPLAGSVMYDAPAGKRSRLAIDLDGQQIDLGQLWPAAAAWIAALESGEAPNALAPASTARPGEPQPTAAPTAAAPFIDTGNMDLVLRLRAAEVAAGRTTLRDVDTDMSVEAGRITFPRLRLTSADGLEVDVEGELADVATAPRGVMRGLVGADSAKAVEALTRLVGLAAPADAGQARLAALAPLRLAGRASIGARGRATADIDIDGIVQGGRFVARARLDAGWQRWRSGPAEIAVTADTPDTEELLRIALGTRASDRTGREPRRGSVRFLAHGVAETGLLASAVVDAQGLSMTYEGPLKLVAGKPAALDGEMRVAADRTGDALELVGLNLAAGAAAYPLEGALHVEARDGVVTLRPRDLLVGTARIGGYLIAAQRPGKPVGLTAALDVDEAHLTHLLSPLTDRRPAVAPSAAANRESAWPEAQFDFEPLQRAEGRVELRFKRLVLDDGIVLGKGKAVLALATRRLEIETLQAAAPGGEVTAKLGLAKVPGGAELAGTVSVVGTPVAGSKGRLALTVDVRSRGTSAQSLISGLGGKGHVTLDGVAVSAPPPAAVRAASGDLVAGRAEAGDGALSRALAAIRSGVSLPDGRRELTIEGGTLRLAGLRIAGEGGSTTIDTSLDLAAWRLDSEWRIEIDSLPDATAPPAATAQPRRPSPTGGRPQRAALPAVFVVYAGPLKSLSAIEPRISAGALERELAVRRMEREVEELERLRREDEQRRAEEQERQRALEAERARAVGIGLEPAPLQRDPAAPGDAAPQAAPGASGAAAGTPAVPPTGAPPAGQPPAAPTVERNGLTRTAPPPRPAARSGSTGDDIIRQLSPY